MIFSKKILLVLLIFIYSFSDIFAEGTAQIRPTSSDYGRFVINMSFTDFALFNGSADNRLNIHINQVGEKINWGFGKIYDSSMDEMEDLYYRIVAPDGSIAYGGGGGTLIPTSGAGFISSYSAAVAGPNTINSAGYQALSITATMTGDYRIEFFFSDMYSPDVRREIDLMDITITNSAGNALQGRIWSKAWQFSVGIDYSANDPYNHRFRGSLFVYADDGVVSKINFNNIQPLVFLVSCNEFGTSNTGNFSVDRRSVSGKHVIPQYKIFLNNPDISAYPTGTFETFVGAPQFLGCSLNNLNFQLNVSGNGVVKTFINLNGIPAYQANSTDVEFLTNINAGINNISWNGLDGLGNPHDFDSPIEVVFTLISGLTNLPMYDIEYNRSGFKVEIIRPSISNPTPPLFWDDNLISGGSEFSGCYNSGGCHLWDGYYDNIIGLVYSMGNENTVNTWWFAQQSIVDTIQIFPSTLVFSLSDSLVCAGSLVNINVSGAQTYQWASAPNDPTIAINAIGNSVEAHPQQSTLYSVSGTDARGCIVEGNASITVLNGPVLTTNDPQICFGDSALLVVQGGETYTWENSSHSASISVLPSSSQIYSVTAFDSGGCPKDTFVSVTVWPLPNVALSPDSVCFGSTINLFASGAIHYSWSNGIIGNPLSFSPNSSSLISVEGTDFHGCSDTASAFITVLPLPDVFAGWDTAVCSGQPVSLSAWGNAQSYLWETSDTARNITVYPQNSHNYFVIGIDSNNCQKKAFVNVVAFPLPAPAIFSDPMILPSYNHVALIADHTSGNIIDRVWRIDEFVINDSLQFSYDFGEDFSGESRVFLTVTNDKQCVDSTFIILIVRPFQTLFIPNAFSPNGDGINDLYHFYGKNWGEQDFHFRIYNRWGTMIFYSDNPTFAWDGTFKGEKCQSGVYNFILSFTDSDLISHEVKGYIYLHQ